MKTLSIFLLAAACLPASIIVSVEAPGVQYTTRSGVITETFDSVPTGVFTPFASPVGLFTGDGVIVRPGNDWGGSGQTPYVATGVQSGPEPQTMTLTFGGLRSYVGFYLGALDPRNTFSLYNGPTLLTTYGQADILSLLTPAYRCNPNLGTNCGEAYVYLNFDSNAPGSNFDKVVWQNLDGFLDGGLTTGEEWDSVSVADGTQRTISPEPGTITLFVIGGVLSCMARLRRKA